MLRIHVLRVLRSSDFATDRFAAKRPTAATFIYAPQHETWIHEIPDPRTSLKFSDGEGSEFTTKTVRRPQSYSFIYIYIYREREREKEREREISLLQSPQW